MISVDQKYEFEPVPCRLSIAQDGPFNWQECFTVASCLINDSKSWKGIKHGSH